MPLCVRAIFKVSRGETHHGSTVLPSKDATGEASWPRREIPSHRSAGFVFQRAAYITYNEATLIQM